ncbi:MAG: S8 family serine peptidase [Desulforhabdus sp.]|jgi:subtilisin family serine protease|nr:S8 family serine peptidase [Desulforhabdus sp.]
MGEKVTIASRVVFVVLGFICSLSFLSTTGNCALDAGEALLLSSKNVKLRSPDRALAAFRDGREKSRFIVILAESGEMKEAVALDSETAKGARRAEVAAVLDGFLNRKRAEEVGEVTRRFSYMPGFAATLTVAQLHSLLASDEVASIEVDGVNKPHLRQGIPLMKASDTRSKYKGQGVAVAICDTGVDYRNTYLGAAPIGSNTKVIGGYDTGLNQDDPMDTDGHGTSCAGIVAGTVADSGDYIGGAAPEAKIYALKIVDNSGDAADSAIIAAWEWCITHQNDNAANPIRIISTSFGGERYTSNCDTDLPAYVTTVEKVTAAGITIFASSGNEGYCDAMGSPACLSGVISVGAVYDAAFGIERPCVEAISCAPKVSTKECDDSGYYVNDQTAADRVAAYSDTASFLTLLAPSDRCYTLQCSAKGSTFDTHFGGTSAACPYAAGAATALQSAAKIVTGKYLTPQEVKTYLTSTGKLVTDSKVAVTKPRVNLAAAINAWAGSGSSGADPTPYLLPLLLDQ